jgi:hypothetical protein
MCPNSVSIILSWAKGNSDPPELGPSGYDGDLQRVGQGCSFHLQFQRCCFEQRSPDFFVGKFQANTIGRRLGENSRRGSMAVPRRLGGSFYKSVFR